MTFWTCFVLAALGFNRIGPFLPTGGLWQRLCLIIGFGWLIALAWTQLSGSVDGPADRHDGPVPEHSASSYLRRPASTKPDVFDAAFWDARYASAPAIWSGKPNPQLVAEAAELTPTTALDVGCGEGADAVWLAARGWQVTALDISRVALDRAAAHARAAGPEIAERITWQQADLTEGVTLTETYGLVSAQFMHLPQPQRDNLYRALAALVAADGTLLVVGHHPSDLETAAHLRPHHPELMFTADEIAALLDPADWQIVTAEARSRSVVDGDGRDVNVKDAVLVARRLNRTQNARTQLTSRSTGF